MQSLADLLPVGVDAMAESWVTGMSNWLRRVLTKRISLMDIGSWDSSSRHFRKTRG
jgi:hypothetical protein